jgi:cellobiose phosphorylase
MAGVQRTFFAYDANNRPRFTVDPTGAVVENVCDAGGNQIAMVRYADRPALAQHTEAAIDAAVDRVHPGNRATHYAHDAAGRLRTDAERLREKLDLAWDGDWYRRAYTDDGTPIGSAQNDECRIDAIAQSWAVLSGAAPLRRAEHAIDAVRTHLIRRDARLLLLFTPLGLTSTQWRDDFRRVRTS